MKKYKDVKNQSGDNSEHVKSRSYVHCRPK